VSSSVGTEPVAEPAPTDMIVLARLVLSNGRGRSWSDVLLVTAGCVAVAAGLAFQAERSLGEGSAHVIGLMATIPLALVVWGRMRGREELTITKDALVSSWTPYVPPFVGKKPRVRRFPIERLERFGSDDVLGFQRIEADFGYELGRIVITKASKPREFTRFLRCFQIAIVASAPTVKSAPERIPSYFASERAAWTAVGYVFVIAAIAGGIGWNWDDVHHNGSLLFTAGFLVLTGVHHIVRVINAARR
jgi:hypothetical protein